MSDFELISMRTEYTKTFDTREKDENGETLLKTVVGNNTPIHYMNKDIDTNLQKVEPEGSLWEFKYFCDKNTYNSYFSDLKSDNEALASFEINGKWINYKPYNANPTGYIVNDNRIKYLNCYNGIDIEYEVSPNKMKEYIYINSPEAVKDIIFTLKLEQAMKLEELETGEVALINTDSNEEYFRISKPWAFDSNNIENHALSFEVSELDGYTSLTIVNEDLEWFFDSSRVYPVIIDPTTTVNNVLLNKDYWYNAPTGISSNVVPQMTSNTAPSGIASANSEYPGRLAYKAFNRNSSTVEEQWTGNTGFPTWIAYEFPSAKAITMYTISVNYVPEAPKSWTFEGWNGSSWIVLDTQSNITSWVSLTKKSFTFTNSTTYIKYRLNISAGNSGNSYCTIDEIEMMETLINPISQNPYNFVGTTADFTATNSVVPVMTGYTTTSNGISYVASASSEWGGGYAAFYAFDGIASDTRWITSSGLTTGWLKIDLGASNAKKISRYSIAASSNVTESPKSWTLEGSNTGAFSGEQVIISRVGTGTNDDYAIQTGWTQYVYREFTIPKGNISSYRYYRINITANNGYSYVGFTELKLFEDTYKDKFRTNLSFTTPSQASAIASAILTLTLNDNALQDQVEIRNLVDNSWTTPSWNTAPATGSVFKLVTPTVSYTAGSANIIPAMSADSSVINSKTYVASASSTYASGFEAFHAFNSSQDSEGWVSANGQTTGTLAIQLPDAKRVGKYAIKIGINTTEPPKTWTMEGSNDGTTWTVLSRVGTGTNDDYALQSSWTANETRNFTIKTSNIASYTRYRLNITSNNGAAYIGVDEFKLFDSLTQYNLDITEILNNSVSNGLNYCGMLLSVPSAETTVDASTGKNSYFSFYNMDDTSLYPYLTIVYKTVNIPSTFTGTGIATDSIKWDWNRATTEAGFVTNYDFNDSTGFTPDQSIVFDGKMYSKTVYQSTMTDGGFYLRGTINKSSSTVKAVEKVEVI